MPYRISVVCTGNICRSPMGEAVLRDAFATAGLGDQVEVVSAGTSATWHLGDDADRRTHAVLRQHGHQLTGHQATQFYADEFDSLDLVLALDDSHRRALEERATTPLARGKIRLIREFDPTATPGAEVEDPYYGDQSDFETVYTQVSAAVDGIVAHVRRELP